jgi:hypothetical protein
MREKLKSFLLDDAIFYALLIICIASVAFLLGKQSMNQSTAPQPAGVVISQPSAPSAGAETSSETMLLGQGVVASKSGTKYHLPSCPGAKQIKEANLIRFASIDAARAAGYSAAANCEGLPNI